MVMGLGGGHLGCLSLRVPIGVTSKTLGGGGRCSFLTRHRAGSGHKPNSPEDRAFHLALQEHVVLQWEPHPDSEGTLNTVGAGGRVGWPPGCPIAQAVLARGSQAEQQHRLEAL